MVEKVPLMTVYPFETMGGGTHRPIKFLQTYFSNLCFLVNNNSRRLFDSWKNLDNFKLAFFYRKKQYQATLDTCFTIYLFGNLEKFHGCFLPVENLPIQDCFSFLQSCRFTWGNFWRVVSTLEPVLIFTFRRETRSLWSSFIPRRLRIRYNILSS